MIDAHRQVSEGNRAKNPSRLDVDVILDRMDADGHAIGEVIVVPRWPKRGLDRPSRCR
jgi:hypothetical protein